MIGILSKKPAVEKIIFFFDLDTTISIKLFLGYFNVLDIAQLVLDFDTTICIKLFLGFF
jgi:hypothetical protein